jgi:exosortase D (VPLPA-CTERM-specific)
MPNSAKGQASHIFSSLTAYEMPFRPIGFGLLLIALIAAAGVYSFGMTSIADAWAKPEYSHGPLIPLLSAYLFLRQIRHEPPLDRGFGDVGERWTGVAVLMAGLAIGMFGNIAQIADITYYAFIIWTWGLIMVCFGRRRGFAFWPPVLHLIFMLPLPNFLYWKVSTTLQLVSSEIGVSIISMMGIPVFLDGVVIDLGTYKLHVAEACSGLRYLFPVLSFSYIFAVLYNGPKWHKIVLLASAVPITVLMNSVRIGIIGVMVDNVGIEWVEGFTHFFEGWIIFMTCVAILFGLAILMQRFTPNPRPLAEVIDVDFDGFGQQLKRVFSVVPSAALIVSCVIATGAALSWHLVTAPEMHAPERRAFSLFPETLGGRQGTRAVLDPQVANVLDATDYISIAYNGGPDVIGSSLFIAYYRSLTEGSGVHSPEVCLPGGGWEMAEIGPQTRMVETANGPQQVTLNRAIIQNGQAQQLVYYWFDRSGAQITSDWTLKLIAIRDRALTGRNDGALVRLITSIGQGERIESAEARLDRLLGDIMPILPQYLPE